jgi:K(+)-stimulated pyrophosphate-energized sodium pump
MGPVTIAVDSYGPVTDNAQSVYELSLIENVPDVSNQIQKEFGFKPTSRRQGVPRGERRRGQHLQGHRQAGAHRHGVVGATTMIFSIIMVLTSGLTQGVGNLSLLHAPFLLGW